MSEEMGTARWKGFDWSGLTLFLLTLGAIGLSTFVIWPFLPGITAAVVLAVVTARPFAWLETHLKNRTLAASCAVLLVVLSLVGPTVLMITNVSGHVVDAVRSLQDGTAERELNLALENHPQIERLIARALENIDASQTVEKAAGLVASRIGDLLSHSVAGLVQIVAMLFILFFLYRDREDAAEFARSLLPVAEEENRFLLRHLREAVTALVLGRFVVAGIQGVLAGATYALLGLKSALVLGAATTLFALVPAVGAVAVWLPVVVFLALTHHWVEAVVLLGVGSLAISTLDNFLYPVLVGTRLKLHTVPIFLAMIGGVWLFGVAGIVLGPVLFNVTNSLMLIWRHRAHGEPLPGE
jgi:predicted PurR-regulated permease PerM